MYSTPALDFHALPASAQEVVDVIGMAPALALIDARGGVRTYIPSPIPADHWLIAIIGAEAAEQLAAVYAGDELNLPRCCAAMRATLYRQICAAYDAGESAATLALAHGFTERWVYAIVARRRCELASSQASLF